jgi:hypothetical protein
MNRSSAALCPFVGIPGLFVSIRNASIFCGQTLYNLPDQVVALTPNASNYVSLNLVNFPPLVVQVNTTGFVPVSYPICVAVTDSNGITRLTDSRPDLYLGAHSGWG